MREDNRVFKDPRGNRCDECDKLALVVVGLATDFNYASGAVRLCEPCLRKALARFDMDERCNHCQHPIAWHVIAAKHADGVVTRTVSVRLDGGAVQTCEVKHEKAAW